MKLIYRCIFQNSENLKMSQVKNKRNRSKLSTTSLDDLNATKKPNHRANTILESSEEEKQENVDEYVEVFTSEGDEGVSDEINK